MSVGVILLGMLVGAGAGAAALIFGLSVWTALLIYAGAGSLTIGIWIAVYLLLPKKLPTQVVTDA